MQNSTTKPKAVRHPLAVMLSAGFLTILPLLFYGALMISSDDPGGLSILLSYRLGAPYSVSLSIFLFFPSRSFCRPRRSQTVATSNRDYFGLTFGSRNCDVDSLWSQKPGESSGGFAFCGEPLVFLHRRRILCIFVFVEIFREASSVTQPPNTALEPTPSALSGPRKGVGFALLSGCRGSAAMI